MHLYITNACILFFKDGGSSWVRIRCPVESQDHHYRLYKYICSLLFKCSRRILGKERCLLLQKKEKEENGEKGEGSAEDEGKESTEEGREKSGEEDTKKGVKRKAKGKSKGAKKKKSTYQYIPAHKSCSFLNWMFVCLCSFCIASSVVNLVP